ncbi:MAG: family 1 glycosylhydrolase, partial [Candidatus Omnitrophica bacterium]|nr:family 1 glycosylhydrolase [Candidatus Omnitrophota bacterium]
YITGAWPPQRKSLAGAKSVGDNLVSAHLQAYRLIHDIYRAKGLPSPKVSIAQNMQAFQPCSPTLRNRLAVYLRQRFINFAFVDRLARHHALDYLGINYYTRNLAEPRSWRPGSLLRDDCRSGHHPRAKNDMGWDIYPEGLFELAVSLAKRYTFPLFILENGICTADDRLRSDFIRAHLLNLQRAMEKGARVLGYLYWSLLDNYEWDKGFAPRFGLIGVDYRTQERTVRESAGVLARVCETGNI